MATRQFKLPDLGEGLEDAQLIRWLVAEEADISLNQPLVEVDTAKALVEIPSPFAGTVKKLHASEGEVVAVGSVLVTFEVADDASPGGRKAVLVGYGVDEQTKPARRRKLSGVRGPGRSGARAESVGAATVDEPTAPPLSAAVPAAPPIRKLAAELGVDLNAVKGTGPDGRVTRDDVLLAASTPQASSADSTLDERVPVRGARRLIAEKMSQSVREIPHVTTYLSFDASSVMRLKQELTDANGIKVTPLAVVAKAFVQLCVSHRELNASFDSVSAEIILFADVHLGIATDTERGLMVPVIRSAPKLGFAELAEQIQVLSTSARSGKISVDELRGSTVTISNVGSFGAEFGTPIINHPESSILALGVIEPRPVADQGTVSVRPMATLSLSFDHRVLDGAAAGRALLELRDLLQDYEALGAL